LTPDSDRTDGEDQFGLTIQLQEFIRSGERATYCDCWRQSTDRCRCRMGLVSAYGFGIILGVVSRFPERALVA
jgi:hypothetical protein